MSTRKPTIDDLDDVDDEDGVLEEEKRAETDLETHVMPADRVGLGHTPPDRDPYVEDPPRKAPKAGKAKAPRAKRKR